MPFQVYFHTRPTVSLFTGLVLPVGWKPLGAPKSLWETRRPARIIDVRKPWHRWCRNLIGLTSTKIPPLKWPTRMAFCGAHVARHPPSECSTPTSSSTSESLLYTYDHILTITGSFSRHSLENSRWKKLKLKTQELFRPKLTILSNFSEIWEDF